MRKIVWVILVLAIWINCYSEPEFKYNHSIGIDLSIDQIQLNHSKLLGSQNLELGYFVGFANKDIDNKFNDFYIGASVEKKVIGNEIFKLKLGVTSLLYFPNNDFYDELVLGVGIFSRGEYYFINQRNCLFLNIGFIYGEREYKQEYNDQILVESVDVFSITGVNISIGYSFKF
jgi:hypothetical protein